MAIFNRNIDEYPDIEATTECGYKIAEEGYNDIELLVSNLEATNVLIESGIYDGEFQTILEDSSKTIFEKAKERFIEFGQKIKAWFKKVFDYIKEKFSKVSNFFKTNKNKFLSQIKDKHIVDRHHFNTNIFDDVEDCIKKIRDICYSPDIKKYENSTDFKHDILDILNVESISDIKENFNSKYVGTLYTNEYINRNDVDKMWEYLASIDAFKSSYQVLYTIITGSVEKSIATTQSMIVVANKVGKLVGHESNTFDYKSAIIKIQNQNFALNCMQQLNTTAFDITNKITSEYISILKKVSPKDLPGDYKVALKESSENISVYESAMLMF